MAKKLEKPSAKPDAVDNDLEILHPERSLIIGDKTITVREYGFIEGLRLHKTLAPFMDAIYGLLDGAAKPTLNQVLIVIVDHLDSVLPAIAESANVDIDFVNSLSEAEGYALIYTWWAVNGPFFWRRAFARKAGEALEQQAKIQSAGQMSITPLSPVATNPSE